MDNFCFFNSGSIIRSVQDNIVRGTAICYYDPANPGTECQPYADGCFERLAAGCFDDIFRSNKLDVIATFDHKQANLLGRTPATLKLNQSRNGIDVELNLPETSLGKDMNILIQRGDIQGFSFIAKPAAGGSTMSQEGGKTIRTIKRFERLAEVSLVSNPYYTGATIQRSRLDWHEEEMKAWLKMEQTKMMIQNCKALL